MATRFCRLRWIWCSCPGYVGRSMAMSGRCQFQYILSASMLFAHRMCSSDRMSIRISSASVSPICTPHHTLTGRYSDTTGYHMHELPA